MLLVLCFWNGPCMHQSQNISQRQYNIGIQQIHQQNHRGLAVYQHLAQKPCLKVVSHVQFSIFCSSSEQQTNVISKMIGFVHRLLQLFSILARLKCLKSFSSSGNRNPLVLTFNTLIQSKLIFFVSSNSGGLKGRGTSVMSGSSGIDRRTWQPSGKFVDTG